MSIKNRYNELITALEEVARDIETKVTADTVYTIAMKFGMEVRDLNAVIRFLLGKTVIEYVKDRKLMAAYEYIISAESLDIEGAIVISGLDNHSSFDKRFKQYFGLSPKEAFQSKDRSLYEEVVTWDLLSQDLNDFSLDEEEEEEKITEKTLYGIPRKQFTKMLEALDLQALYGFDIVYGLIGFDLAESLSIPLKDSFEFMDSIHDYFEEMEEFRRSIHLPAGLKDDEEDGEEEEDEEFSEENRVRRIAFDKFYQFMYFKCYISVSLARITQYRIDLSDEDMMKLDPDLIYEFASLREETDIDFKYFKRAYDYYMEHATDAYSDEDFEDFLDAICRGEPIESAFPEFPFWDDSDPDLDAKSYEEDLLYEESKEGRLDRLLDGVVHEEEDLCSGERFDFDIDEENYNYWE